MYYKEKPLYLLALIIPVVSLIIIGIILLGYHKEYKQASDEYQEIADTYTSKAKYVPSSTAVSVLSNGNTNAQVTASADTFEFEDVDFLSLSQINPDIVGWITLPLCNINYPIVQGSDNEYYLKRTYKLTENSSGSIFMDSENAANFNDMHTIIYGHNMKDNSMFGGLKKIRSNPSIVNGSPYLYIYTPDGKIRQYRIFACRVVADDSDAYRFFTGNDYYNEYIKECLTQSKPGIDSNLDYSNHLPIITLSTCSGDNERFLVHCVLVNIM